MFLDVLRDVRALVEQQASPRGTLRVSSDLAAMFQAVARCDGEVGALSSGGVLDADSLDALRAEVAGCMKCGLCSTRTQTVFSDGNPHAELVFVGEAPGADEDRQGVPFVGRAGQLLTDIIEKGMKLRREDVYICNILKCRPPNNRDPNADEIDQCEPYLIRQLALVRPKVICCLGRVAAQTLLKTTTPIGRLRGQWFEYHGIPLRVTYHPSYILHQRDAAHEREAKRKTWEDVQEVMKLLQRGASS